MSSLTGKSPVVYIGDLKKSYEFGQRQNSPLKLHRKSPVETAPREAAVKDIALLVRTKPKYKHLMTLFSFHLSAANGF